MERADSAASTPTNAGVAKAQQLTAQLAALQNQVEALDAGSVPDTVNQARYGDCAAEQPDAYHRRCTDWPATDSHLPHGQVTCLTHEERLNAASVSSAQLAAQITGITDRLKAALARWA
jgi:hypothetical protein